MGFKFRKRFRVGPLVLNFTEHGASSWGLKIGRWSWNAKTRKHTVDTPGLGYWESGGKKKSKKK